MDCISHVDVGDHDDQPEMFTCLKRVAKKAHRCSECGKTIEPGSKYLCESMLHEGTFTRFKTCEDCRSLRASFFGAGWVFTQLWSDLDDHIHELGGDVSEIHIACLTPAARERVCDMIEAEWEWQDEQHGDDQ